MVVVSASDRSSDVIHAIDLGAMTPFFYTFREREQILDFFEAYCGARLTLNCMRIGGMPEDVPPGWLEDIEAFASRCQFRDCRHESEPGCAVRANVAEDRLLNYHKLLRDAQRSYQTPLERIALRQKWKSLRKAGAVRAREKRN